MLEQEILPNLCRETGVRLQNKGEESEDYFGWSPPSRKAINEFIRSLIDANGYHLSHPSA
ncbi:hypothetical protein LTS17_008542 [Exophiala oligosperma]